jgi:tRNA threonylcarbamoyladenosine biosynthesis protein TsaE
VDLPFETRSRSVAATMDVAAELARGLKPGDCVTLHGDLGAGKTQFVRGLVRGLGGDERQVSSPTFVLLHVYETPAMNGLKVFHLDAYRLGGGDDFDAIGFDELLTQHGVVVVEWPSKVESALPASRVEVTLDRTGETSRSIRIGRSGEPPRHLKK